MSERIKLTEDQIEVWICGVYINLGNMPTENKTKPKQLKQQILDDHEEVDELVKCYRECRARQENLAISEFETNQQLFMERLYKRATGKEIQEAGT